MDNNVITALIAIVTSISAFIFGNFKARKEIESMTITNVQKSVDVYRLLIDDLKGELTEMIIKLNDLEKKIDELHDENTELRRLLKEHKRK